MAKLIITFDKGLTLSEAQEFGDKIQKAILDGGFIWALKDLKLTGY